MSKPRTFDWDEAKRLFRQGLNYVEIGRLLGVSDTSVARVCADVEPETEVFVQELTDGQGSALVGVAARNSDRLDLRPAAAGRVPRSFEQAGAMAGPSVTVPAEAIANVPGERRCRRPSLAAHPPVRATPTAAPPGGFTR